MSDLTGTKGGSGVWQRIISEMPEHDVYIEAFWGRGTIAKKKRPASATIGIDLDPAAISSGEGSAMMFQCDSLAWLQGYFGSTNATFCGASMDRHLVYLDPPYKGFEHYYKHAVCHSAVIKAFLSLPCPAMLSGYWSEYYAERLDGTRAIQIETVNRAGKRCTEWVWLNFDPPARYHDTRFIGDGRRDRERIRRRVSSWSKGLERMSPAERQAVFEGCEAVIRK